MWGDSRTVYAIKNVVTNRIYVGSTGRPVRYRLHEHFLSLRRGEHRVELFQKDFNEHGEESFACKVIGRWPRNEALRMEVFMMKVLRTQSEKYGYNYKDDVGTTPRAIAERWRTPSYQWSFYKLKNEA